MTRGRKATLKTKNPETRKYKICPECGLNIRCGDIEKHKEGYAHKNKGKKVNRY